MSNFNILSCMHYNQKNVAKKSPNLIIFIKAIVNLKCNRLSKQNIQCKNPKRL